MGVASSAPLRGWIMLKFGKKKGDKAPEGGEVAAGAEGVADGAPKKKKIPLLFIAIPAAVLLLGGGGAGAYFMFMAPKPDAEHGAEKGGDHGGGGGGHGAEKKKEGGGHGGGAEGGEASETGSISPGPDGVTFYALPDMVVNIQSPDGRPTFLKLKLTLEMEDAELAAHLQSEYPRLQDMFQGFLRELRPDDLAGSAGTVQLRSEILRRVNLIAAPGHVDAVLIEEMLVQ